MQGTNAKLAHLQAAIYNIPANKRGAALHFFHDVRFCLDDEREAMKQTAEKHEKECERLRRMIYEIHRAAEEGRCPDDGLTFCFPAAEGSTPGTITCSRALVCQWSPAFAALVRHGNAMDGAFPREVTLGDVDDATFRAALTYMSSGRLPKECVRSLRADVHPLLIFADQYGLQDIVDDYFDVFLKARTLLTAEEAQRILALALRFRATAARDCAAVALARNLVRDAWRVVPGAEEEDLFGHEVTFEEAFVSLDAEAAAVVLAQDELDLKSQHSEAYVVGLIWKWLRGPSGQADRVVELFRTVRFECLSFDEIAALQNVLASEAVLDGGVRSQIKALFSTALRRKIYVPAGDGSPIRLRKRHRACVPDEGGEDRIRTVLRASFDICGIALEAFDPASAPEMQVDTAPAASSQ